VKIAECAALLVTACLVSTDLGCASASRKGLLIKAERLHERGEHTAAMEQLDLLMTTSSPPPEMRSQVIYTRARWVEELGTAESVRQATLQVLRRRRRDGESTHPFHWAGFVAVGAWR
jgi:hypothetical protein